MRYEATKLDREMLKIPEQGGYGVRLRCVDAPPELSDMIGQLGDSHGDISGSDGVASAQWWWRPNQFGPLANRNMRGMWFEIVEAPASPGWIPPPTEPATYDSSAFEADLDLAINFVRSTILGEHEREFSQPWLREGVSMERAFYLVALCLIERKIGVAFPVYLEQVLQETRKLLLEKNQAYGNSALDPVRVFSKASLKEQLLVRLDDKVSRLARGQAAGEDVAGDLFGYLLLVVIAEQRESRT